MAKLKNKKSECVLALMWMGLFKKERAAAYFLLAFSICALFVSAAVFINYLVVPTHQNLATIYNSVDQSVFKMIKKK